MSPTSAGGDGAHRRSGWQAGAARRDATQAPLAKRSASPSQRSRWIRRDLLAAHPPRCRRNASWCSLSIVADAVDSRHPLQLSGTAASKSVTSDRRSSASNIIAIKNRAATSRGLLHLQRTYTGACRSCAAATTKPLTTSRGASAAGWRVRQRAAASSCGDHQTANEGITVSPGRSSPNSCRDPEHESGSYNPRPARASSPGFRLRTRSCAAARADRRDRRRVSPCSTARWPLRCQELTRRAFDKSYTAVEVHAEGEQGTVTSARCSTYGATCETSCAISTRSTTRSAFLVLRTARQAPDQRQPGLFPSLDPQADAASSSPG